MTAGLDEAQVARRLPVWTALSDLFIDTDVAASVPHIARAVIASGYELDEVEAMLRWEVRPAFWSNLLAPAGAWQPWPDAVVRDRILARRGGLATRLLIGRARLFPAREWAAVVSAVHAARAAASVAAIQPPPSTRSPA